MKPVSPVQTLEAVSETYDRLSEVRRRERELAAELRADILQARAAGHSLADIAQVLGVSRQRVDQLSR